ncbi:hypothetical protein BKA93DRAFT_105959 [Sparassis latifolia]
MHQSYWSRRMMARSTSDDFDIATLPSSRMHGLQPQIHFRLLKPMDKQHHAPTALYCPRTGRAYSQTQEELRPAMAVLEGQDRQIISLQPRSKLCKRDFVDPSIAEDSYELGSRPSNECTANMPPPNAPRRLMYQGRSLPHRHPSLFRAALCVSPSSPDHHLYSISQFHRPLPRRLTDVLSRRDLRCVLRLHLSF